MSIDTGDDVFVESVGENWLVAMNEGGYVTCCGFPESKVKAEDCVLVRKAHPEDRYNLLHELAKISGPRGIYARRVINQDGRRLGIPFIQEPTTKGPPP